MEEEKIPCAKRGICDDNQKENLEDMFNYFDILNIKIY